MKVNDRPAWVVQQNRFQPDRQMQNWFLLQSFSSTKKNQFNSQTIAPLTKIYSESTFYLGTHFYAATFSAYYYCLLLASILRTLLCVPCYYIAGAFYPKTQYKNVLLVAMYCFELKCTLLCFCSARSFCRILLWNHIHVYMHSFISLTYAILKQHRVETIIFR